MHGTGSKPERPMLIKFLTGGFNKKNVKPRQILFISKENNGNFIKLQVHEDLRTFLHVSPILFRKYL
jgi:hypothetical protein